MSDTPKSAAQKEVFVVTSGSYSDYAINAIFSSRKAAQKYIDSALEAKRQSDSDDGEDYIGNCYWASYAEIEVWPLNSERDAEVYYFWTLGMLLDDGSVCETAREGKEFGIPTKSEITQCGDKVPFHGNRPIVRVKSLKSAAHAMKLAVEARQAWLRKKVEP